MESSKPRILIAASTFPPDSGGPAIHAFKQFEFLKNNNYKVNVVTLAEYRKFPRWLRHLYFLGKLISEVFKYEVIYAHDAWGVGFPALLAARVSGKKFLVRIGGDMAWEREIENGGSNLSLKEWYKSNLYKKNKFYRLTKIVLGNADAIIVPSPILKDLYRESYKVGSNKIFVIPNPIPENSNNSEIVKPNIVYASRLVSYKNLDFVLESLAKVFPSYPDIKFLIMGDGPERKNLLNKVKELNISNQVVFTGNISNEEVIKNTSECFLGLAPALTEFNPNYILQCLSFGKPFLMSRENGLPFDVPEEFLFDPRNHIEFETKLQNMLVAENYKKALETVSRFTFKMSWNDVFEQNLKIIEGLLNR